MEPDVSPQDPSTAVGITPEITTLSSDNLQLADGADNLSKTEIEAQEASAPTWGQTFSIATDEWLHNLVPLMNVQGQGTPLQEITEEMEVKAGINTMPPEFRNYVIEKSNTDTEFEYYSQIARQRITNLEKMQNASVPKIIAGALVSAFDPAELAITTIATLGMGTVVKAGFGVMEGAVAAKNALKLNQSAQAISALSKTASLSKGGAFARGAAANMALTAPFELTRQAFLPDYGAGDFAMVMGFAGGLGGIGGRMVRGHDTTKLAAILYKREQLGEPLTHAEKQFFAPIIGTETLAERSRALENLFGDTKIKTPTAAKASAETLDATGSKPAPVGLGINDVFTTASDDALSAMTEGLSGTGAKLVREALEKGMTYRAIQVQMSRLQAARQKARYTLDNGSDDEIISKFGKGVKPEDFEDYYGYLGEVRKKADNSIHVMLRKEEAYDAILNQRLERMRDVDIPAGVQGIDTGDIARYENAPFLLGVKAFMPASVRRNLSSLARGAESKIGAMRQIFFALGTNHVGLSNRQATNFSAEEIRNWVQAKKDGQWLPKHQLNQKEWIKKNGKSQGRMVKSPMQFMRDQMEFNALVARHRRYGDVSDPLVVASANDAKRVLDEVAQMALDAKVRGFSSELLEKNYLPRIYNDVSMDAVLQKLGKEGFKERFINAVAKGNPEMDIEVAQRIGRGYAEALLKRMQQRSLGGQMRNVSQVAQDSVDDVLDIIRAEKTLSEEEFAAIEREIGRVYKFSSVGKEGISRVRKRMQLDERYIDDMTENDIEQLMQAYTFQMGGQIGLARNGIDVEGGKSFEEMLSDITKYNQDNRVELDEDTFVDQIAAARFLYDSVTGNLAKDDNLFGTGEKTMRRIRDYNFIRVMGATGLPSLVEIGSLIDHSVGTIFRTIPELRSMWRKTAEGQLDDPLVRELQHSFGTGTDVITGHSRNHWDDHDHTMLQSDFDRHDMFLQKGRQATAMASGMLPVTAILRRLDGYMFAQDFFGAAMKKGADKSRVYSDIKLEQIGISPKDYDGIMEMIRKHAAYDKSGKLITLNLDKWKADNPKLHDVFSLAGRRHVLNAVQETSSSSVNRFLRTSVGRTLFQFMSYPIAASEQQAQRLGVRALHGDAGGSARIILSQALIATMVYYVGIHNRAAGMSEKKRKQYLKDNLDMSSVIAKGTLGYLGFSGAYGAFANQLTSGNMMQSPTTDLLGGASKLFNAGSDGLFNGKPPSEGTIRQLTRLTPLQNWYGTNYILNKMSAQLGN